MLGLRTTAGVDLDHFRARFGFDLMASNEALLERLTDEGHLAIRSDGAGHRLMPTLSGLAVADGMAGAFDLPL
jgi:coproporphyrinogen III oxidase-like Fe-S oxidoreductase